MPGRKDELFERRCCEVQSGSEVLRRKIEDSGAMHEEKFAAAALDEAGHMDATWSSVENGRGGPGRRGGDIEGQRRIEA